MSTSKNQRPQRLPLNEDHPMGDPSTDDDHMGRHEGGKGKGRERDGAPHRLLDRTSDLKSWSDEMDEVDNARLRRHDDTLPRWVYQPDQRLIIHRDGCQTCRTYALHQFESSIVGDLSLEHALHKQCQSLGDPLRLDLARADVELARRESDISHLESVIESLKRRVRRLEGEAEERTDDGPSRKRS